MAYVRKRGNSFQITVSCGYDSSGKRVTRTTTFTPDAGLSKKRAQAEAEKFTVRFEDKIKTGGNISGDKLTLVMLCVEFLEDMEDEDCLAVSTLEDYRKHIESRIIPSLGHLKLTQITNHVVKGFLKELRNGDRLDDRDGTLSEGTVTKYRATISTVLSYAVEEGYLPLNPLIYSGKQRGRAKTKREYKTKQLTIEQTKRFLWLLNNPVEIRRQQHTAKRNGQTILIKEYSQTWSLDLKWRLFFYIAIFTGARRGEMISLLWSDIDFSKNSIQFTKSTVRVNGNVIHKDTKTHATRRCIVPDVVIQIARELLNEQKKLSLQLGESWMGLRGNRFSENFVFIQDRGQQMNINSPRTEFRRLIRIYNTNVAQDESEMLPKDLTLHDLRHTTASILINKKLDPRSVAGVLGHSNTSTTLNIYAYFFHQTSEEAARIMSETLIEPQSQPYSC